MEDKNTTVHSEDGFKTAAEKAYSIISKKILSGELEPGCKLSRRKMAELTGVSVIPVIEALNRLEEDGLVESKPQWGSYVTVPTPEKILEMYVLREAIECQVARILSQKINADQEKVLRNLAQELDNIELNPSTAQNHYEFHSKMAEFTGYNSLINALRRINLFWVLCKAVSSRKERMPLSEDWHMRVVDAIMTGDPDKAEAVMRIHIFDFLRAMGIKLEEKRNI